jgi:uncharacterized membrane protein
MSEQNRNDSNKPLLAGWFGPFYYNPDDPRVILPKRWGYGWTLNFARPASRLIILALFVLPLFVEAAVLLTRN